jgi:transcription-repair coupling factor (superfamily II helicase)
MLERTVAELRGEAIEDEASVALNLGIDLSIPEDYIGDMGQRLRAYKRIASARDDEQLARIHAEMEDRYGRLPEQVENLFAYARLRRMAEEMGVLSIDRTIDGLAIKLSERARVAPERLIALVRERPGASFSPSGVLRINLDEGEAEQIIRTAQRLLAEIRAQQ